MSGWRAGLLELLVAGALTSATLSEPQTSRISVREVTVRVDNSSASYPDLLLLLPPSLPAEQQDQLLYQLGDDVTDNHVTSRVEGGDLSQVVGAVLRAAARELQAHNKSSPGDYEEAPGYLNVYFTDSGKPGGRRRRTAVKSGGGVRLRRAYTKQWQDLCDSCPSLAPQQPVIINIIKTGSGCEGDCGSKQPACGQPHCGQYFPHHPPPFHPPPPPHLHHWPPPPPPPPHFHNYPPPQQFYPQPAYHAPAQPTTTAPRPATRPPQQQSPPVNKCDPCAAPSSGQGGAPNFGGSFSQSSASAQSSSFAWSGKR